MDVERPCSSTTYFEKKSGGRCGQFWEAFTPEFGKMRQDQPMPVRFGITELDKTQPVTADGKNSNLPYPKNYPINYSHENGQEFEA
jgi:hypothetical protein